METPMPDTSSKLADLDYTTFLKKDSHHLSCPECEIIPALFIEKDSKNLFSISSGCENKHVVHNISVRDFYKKSLTKNEINEKETITLCQEHNEKYESFCKSCHKNICAECLNKSHQNHNILKFKDFQPSNDEITNLKNSIKNEIKITSEFLTLEFNRWLDELRDKFDDMMDVIAYKNKLYNQIISNYESGNLNYQIIHNIKIILKDQISRNPISKELANLLKVISSAKKEEKQVIFNEDKNKQFLHILDIENLFVEMGSTSYINNTANLPNKNNTNNMQKNNNNSNSNANSNPEQFLADFINNPTRKAQPQPQQPPINLNQSVNFNNQYNQNNYQNLNGSQTFRKLNSVQINQSMNFNQKNMNQNPNMPINPFNDSNLNRSTTINMNNNFNPNSARASYPNNYNNNYNNNFYNNYNNNNYSNDKNSFYNINKDIPKCEFQLNGKKVKQTIDLKEFIHSITLLKAANSQRLAVGLENGIVKIFSFDEKSGEISSQSEIKEHEKSVTTVLGLNNGNLLTCSQDKSLKIINIPQKSLVNLFKSHSVLQVLQCKPDAFYFITALEMTDGNIIAGDWKNIMVYKPFKKEGNNEGYEYKEINQIVINSRTTALLQVDDGVFISAHYNINLINFYDTKRQRTRTLNNIKCSDESPNCLCIIGTNTNPNEEYSDNTDKVIVVGGIQCMFFISVKYQSLITKLFLPDVSYIRTIINTGNKFYSNSIVCSGLFRQYSNDLVLFNITNQGGYNKFNLLENFRLSEVDRGSINSIVLLKKANVNDSSGIIMVTGGTEKKLKVYA